MDWGLFVIGAAGFTAFLVAFMSSNEDHEDFLNAQGNIGKTTTYWFNQSNRIVYFKPPTAASYPYVTFRTDAPVGADGGILIQELHTATWFDSVHEALKTMMDLTQKRGSFGSIAVYAIKLESD
jgi:hypothetical protein